MDIGTGQTQDQIRILLEFFSPDLFDPESDSYVPPEIIDKLLQLSESARPTCLPDDQQDLAQAFYLLYLISLRNDLAAGRVSVTTGPVLSEREGDIAVSYADLTKLGAMAGAIKPSSDPWYQWELLWRRCGRGAITSRFGDPVNRRMTAMQLNIQILPMAYGVWRTVF